MYSTKGGVGKTTTAVNLAWEAAKEFRVLLWDLDPQGATTFLLQVKPKVKGGVGRLVAGRSKVTGVIRSTDFDNLDVLPADASYRDLDLVLDHAKKSEHRVAKILEHVDGDYDVVILDCPPGAGLVAENAVYSAHAVVVPLVPSPLSSGAAPTGRISEVIVCSVSAPVSGPTVNVALAGTPGSLTTGARARPPLMVKPVSNHDPGSSLSLKVGWKTSTGSDDSSDFT